MAYCTQSDLEAVVQLETLIDLTDDDGVGSVDATKMQRALDDASATVDGHIRIRYKVPLATTPPFVRMLCVDLALHALFMRRGAGLGMPKPVDDRYRNAIKALEAIRKGELDLGVEPPPATSTAVVAQIDGPEREFTHDTMKDF